MYENTAKVKRLKNIKMYLVEIIRKIEYDKQVKMFRT